MYIFKLSFDQNLCLVDKDCLSTNGKLKENWREVVNSPDILKLNLKIIDLIDDDGVKTSVPIDIIGRTRDYIIAPGIFLSPLIYEENRYITAYSFNEYAESEILSLLKKKNSAKLYRKNDKIEIEVEVNNNEKVSE